MINYNVLFICLSITLSLEHRSRCQQRAGECQRKHSGTGTSGAHSDWRQCSQCYCPSHSWWQQGGTQGNLD